jgi:hypothetical protein
MIGRNEDSFRIFEDDGKGPLSLSEIRTIARAIPTITEIGLNEESRLISFRDEESKWRFNIYYTTRTVGTCITHPVLGKTQLFRRKVGYAMLQDIFRNPRIHTDKGYQRTENAPALTGNKRRNDEIDQNVDDEEAVLRSQLELLLPQVNLIRAQLSSIENKRKSDVRKKQAIEERTRRAIEEQQRREEEEERRQAEIQQRKHYEAERSRRNARRGTVCHWSLTCSDNMPRSMANVACVAIGDEGFVAVMDDGTCVTEGLQDNVIAVLKRQHFRNIAYIALGSADQYYILKTNGKEFYSGSAEFEDSMSESNYSAKFVTFGDCDSFFIEFTDGSKSWSSDLPEYLPYDVMDRLKSEPLKHLWLGTEFSNWQLAYHVVYADGECDGCELPFLAQIWLDNVKSPRSKVKFFLANGSDFFIRYT